jgi:hypothetical protein
LREVRVKHVEEPSEPDRGSLAIALNPPELGKVAEAPAVGEYCVTRVVT